MVQVLNELMDAFRISESAVETLLARAIAVPARRLLRFKRAVSLLVLDGTGSSSVLVRGTYQNPILIQWAASPGGSRTLLLRLLRFS
jgi:hypothetical protein